MCQWKKNAFTNIPLTIRIRSLLHYQNNAGKCSVPCHHLRLTGSLVSHLYNRLPQVAFTVINGFINITHIMSSIYSFATFHRVSQCKIIVIITCNRTSEPITPPSKSAEELSKKPPLTIRKAILPPYVSIGVEVYALFPIITIFMIGLILKQLSIYLISSVPEKPVSSLVQSEHLDNAGIILTIISSNEQHISIPTIKDHRYRHAHMYRST